MLKTTRSQSVNSTSQVTVNGQQITVASMTATLEDNGTISTSTYIQDVNAFVTNRDAVVNDIKEFMDGVYQKSTSEDTEEN